MDSLSAAASIVTILGGAAAVVTWIVRRARKPPPAPPVAPTSTVPSVPATDSSHPDPTKKERVSRRLIANSAALLDDIEYFAAQVRVPEDFDERKKVILDRLAEFRDDIKPLLHDLGDLDVEERVRNLYRVLDSQLPPLLNYRPVVIMGLDDLEPTPTWEEQYRPFREEIQGHIAPITALRKSVVEHAEGAPAGTWTESQRRQIRNEYFATWSAHCPLDKALLRIQLDHTTSETRLLLVFCPNCNRSAESF